jgi:four helix bundle protein
MTMGNFLRIEDLIVYQRLCELYLEVCQITKSWPSEERFELASQVRRSSNSSPANLAEKHSDRHIRNKIEGVNRARGEALETIHHLFIARLKSYINAQQYAAIKERYVECVRMLNGMERTLERQLDAASQRWPTGSASENRPCTADSLNPEP